MFGCSAGGVCTLIYILFPVVNGLRPLRHLGVSELPEVL
jgi:hypothetical protein